MATDHVYRVRFYSLGEDRPKIDFSLPENDGIPWLTIEQIIMGNAPAKNYSPIHLTSSDKGAEKWHVYTVPGTFGLFSKMAIDLIGEYMADYFEFLDASLNGMPFYYPRVTTRLDCLDRERSVIIPFPGEPGSVRRINPCRFQKGKIPDPSIFPIPERRVDIFATDTIKPLVESAKLKGFYFIDAETNLDD